MVIHRDHRDLQNITLSIILISYRINIIRYYNSVEQRLPLVSSEMKKKG